MSIDDKELELVTRASQGDEVAVDALIERHIGGLEAFVRLRAGEFLRGRESTLDLVQSACREVLQHVDRFQYGGEKGFKSWLYETALRKIKNRYKYWGAEKREAANQHLTEGEAQRLHGSYESLITPSRDAAAQEQLAQLEQAMTSLNDEQRQVVVYSRLLGLTHAEIGERIGKSEVATRAILCRALAQLTDLLE